MDAVLEIILALKVATEVSTGLANALAAWQQTGQQPPAEVVASATAIRKAAKARWDAGEAQSQTPSPSQPS